jgi:hypothetical protein
MCCEEVTDCRSGAQGDDVRYSDRPQANPGEGCNQLGREQRLPSSVEIVLAAQRGPRTIETFDRCLLGSAQERADAQRPAHLSRDSH